LLLFSSCNTLSLYTLGCWYKYTFDSTSDGLPINLGKDFIPPDADGDDIAPLPGSRPLYLETDDDFALSGFSSDYSPYIRPRANPVSSSAGTGTALNFYEIMRSHLSELLVLD